MFYLWMTLQITPPDGIIDTGLTINPYGLTVYGALVVILGFINWRLYLDVKDERKSNKELADKTMVLMTKLEERLPSVRQFAELETIMKSVDETVRKIHERRHE